MFHLGWGVQPQKNICCQVKKGGWGEGQAGKKTFHLGGVRPNWNMFHFFFFFFLHLPLILLYHQDHHQPESLLNVLHVHLNTVLEHLIWSLIRQAQSMVKTCTRKVFWQKESIRKSVIKSSTTKKRRSYGQADRKSQSWNTFRIFDQAGTING